MNTVHRRDDQGSVWHHTEDSWEYLVFRQYLSAVPIWPAFLLGVSPNELCGAVHVLHPAARLDNWKTMHWPYLSTYVLGVHRIAPFPRVWAPVPTIRPTLSTV